MYVKRFYNKLSLLKKVLLMLTIFIVGVMAIVLTISLTLSTKEVVEQEKEVSKLECELVSARFRGLLEANLSSLEMVATVLGGSNGSLQPQEQQLLLAKLTASDKHLLGAWIAAADSLSNGTGAARITSQAGLSGLSGMAALKMLSQNTLGRREEVSEPQQVGDAYVVELVVPVLAGDKVVGAVGAYLNLASLSGYLQTSRGFAKVISGNGVVIAHLKSTNIGKTTNEGDQTDAVVDRIKRGESFGEFLYSETFKGDAYKYFSTFTFGNTGKSWSTAYVISKDDFMSHIRKNNILKVIFVLVGIGLALLLIFFLQRRFVQVIVEVSGNIQKLSVGEIDRVDQIPYDSHDEIGELSRSVNKLVDGLTMVATFVKEVAKGNLSAQIVANGPNDMLGNAVIEMKDSLVSLSEKEKVRQQEEQVRTWKIEGLSEINETLRRSNHSLNDLTTAALNDIISYVDAQQGGIFLLNGDEDSPAFELKSCIAFSRKRLMHKVVGLDEGLIGRCYYEKEPIILTEIPQGYTEITSGLGDRRPDSLAIIPLINNEQMLGAIELASFKVFTPDELEYLSKAADALASAVSNMLITERTQALLEQSKLYSEEVSAQEEELRQNIEEMNASREEMERKTLKYERLIEELNAEVAALKEQHTAAQSVQGNSMSV